MTITNGYTDLETLKSYLSISNTNSDTMLEMAINAASRGIDKYCQRKFWLDPEPVTKTFIPNNLLTVTLADNDPFGGDIGSVEGLVVKTDPSGDGTYDVTWRSTDFQLRPVNAPSAWPEARPWTSLRAVGTLTFPWLVNTWLTRLDRVQITALWGWPAVPDAVVQACLIKASRLFHRKDSPQGVAGFGDLGVIRISRNDDPDVCGLLDDGYRREPVLVA
jgi:Phage gp6-like head-tail connector protein